MVVTIVILLILAGITIGTLGGENGLFARAKQAREEKQYGMAEEKVKIAVNSSYGDEGTLDKSLLKENINKIEGLYEQITEEITYDLTIKVDGYEFIITELGQVTCVGKTDDVSSQPNEPEETETPKKLLPNTPETEIGAEVALEEGWETETVRYIKTADGAEVRGLEKVATVYAISDGQNNTIPVPYGFYYVGGTLSTGVIISDNEADKYESGKDKTTYAYTTSLKGNQFVWIPCSESEYKKCSIWNGTTQTGTTLQDANWDTTTPSSETMQIQKYGGFYIGRYEAGLASTISEFTTNQIHTGSDQIYNKSGVPQSKAGIVPWNFIDWTTAKLNAESMYKTNYVYSGLITGTQWDVTLNIMLSKNVVTSLDLVGKAETNKTYTWGNYMNNSIAYTGRLASADNGTTNSRKWTLKPFENATSGNTTSYSSNNGDLLTTGASSLSERYHIFDLAGNLGEWTEETSLYSTSTQWRVSRSGSYINASNDSPACYRGCSTVGHTSLNLGFRVVLYIK